MSCSDKTEKWKYVRCFPLLQSALVFTVSRTADTAKTHMTVSDPFSCVSSHLLVYVFLKKKYIMKHEHKS